MIRNERDMTVEERQRMRGGLGTVQLRHLFTKDELGESARLSAQITLPPGASIGNHAHEGERELFYIMNGQATLTENGEVRLLEPGDASLTGPSGEHSIANQGREPVTLLAVILMG